MTKFNDIRSAIHTDKSLENVNLIGCPQEWIDYAMSFEDLIHTGIKLHKPYKIHSAMYRSIFDHPEMRFCKLPLTFPALTEQQRNEFNSTILKRNVHIWDRWFLEDMTSQNEIVQELAHQCDRIIHQIIKNNHRPQDTRKGYLYDIYDVGNMMYEFESINNEAAFYFMEAIEYYFRSTTDLNERTFYIIDKCALAHSCVETNSSNSWHYYQEKKLYTS